MKLPSAEKDALRAIIKAFDYYMRPGMEIGDGPEPWQALVAAIESARPLVGHVFPPGRPRS